MADGFPTTIAKSERGLVVTVSEKYGPEREYVATVVSENETTIYITQRGDPVISLPKCNYAVTKIKTLQED